MIQTPIFDLLLELSEAYWSQGENPKDQEVHWDLEGWEDLMDETRLAGLYPGPSTTEFTLFGIRQVLSPPTPTCGLDHGPWKWRVEYRGWINEATGELRAH